jgi:hypothetical protein
MERGSKVRIPKGTVITGTFPEGIKEAQRTYTVRVHAFDKGYPESVISEGRVDRVCWVGTGGYWHYADASDVEEIS